MYAVVGCGECGALWIVEGRPETTGCPRCGTRHRVEKLRPLARAEDEDEARQARAALLAERGGHGEAFADLDCFADMAARVDQAGPSDEEYLAGSGLDPDAVAAAGERAGRGPGGTRRDRRETVLAAVRDLETPTEDEVARYAAEEGVPGDAAREVLAKLVRAGDLTESGGEYRVL